MHMLTVSKSEAKLLNSLQPLQDFQGSGRFATDSQGRTRTSDGDPRTGTFLQTLPSVGDTICSVNGVLSKHPNIYIISAT